MKRFLGLWFLFCLALYGEARQTPAREFAKNFPEQAGSHTLKTQTVPKLAQADGGSGWPNFGVCIDLKTGKKGHCGETNGQTSRSGNTGRPPKNPTSWPKSRIMVIKSGCTPEMRRVMAGLPCKEQSICVDTATGRRWDCTGHEPGAQAHSQSDSRDKGLSGRPLPPFVKKAANHYDITLILPETAHLKTLRKRIFGPSAAPFRMAEITGRVLWKGQGRKGAATHVLVRGVVSRDLHFLRQKETRTDAKGYFRLAILVNPKGFIPKRHFSVTVWRLLKNDVILPPVRQTHRSKPSGKGIRTGRGESASRRARRWWGEPAKRNNDTSWSQNGTGHSGKSSRPPWYRHYVVNRKYLKTWNGLSWQWAKVKDGLYHLMGGKGNPNQEQWQRNHAQGRDFANAFELVKDAASGGVGKGAKGVDVAQKIIKGVNAADRYRKNKLHGKNKSISKNNANHSNSWLTNVKNIAERINETFRATDDYNQ